MANYTKDTPGAPTGGFYAIGDNITDSLGIVWKCIVAGAGKIGNFVPSGDGGSTVGEALTTSGVGTKNGATVSVSERGNAVIHKTILTLTATPISIADDADVAQYGGVKVYTFPAGLIMTLGAVVSGNLTGYASLIDTFDGDVALGTAAATTGSTLTGTEADILQSVAIAQAVGEVAAVDAVSVATALTESGARHFDGTATAKEVYLNFVIDDNAAHGAGTATFTGTIALVWVNLGDN